MLETLIALWLTLGSDARDVAADNAYAAFVASWMVAPLPIEGLDESERREVTARLALVAGYRESRGRANPPGSNDAGSACGVMQAHLPGPACARARSSLVNGYAAGITSLVTHVRACSRGKPELSRADVLRGLGAYGAGVCGGWRKGSAAWARNAAF